jgi:hypothetical protein
MVIIFTANWATDCLFVFVNSAINFVKVAMVSAWLSMVSAFATAALARAPKDGLILLAMLSRTFYLAPAVPFIAVLA